MIIEIIFQMILYQNFLASVAVWHAMSHQENVNVCNIPDIFYLYFSTVSRRNSATRTGIARDDSRQVIHQVKRCFFLCGYICGGRLSTMFQNQAFQIVRRTTSFTLQHDGTASSVAFTNPNRSSAFIVVLIASSVCRRPVSIPISW